MPFFQSSEKARDGERDARSKDKDRERHGSKHSRHKSTRDRDRDRDKPSSPSSDSKRRSSMPSIDRASSTSPIPSKSTTPYPSFSKAHSKEAVGSREAIMRPKLNIFTPDPTDLDSAKDGKLDNGLATSVKVPPSPPLTAVDENSLPGKREAEEKGGKEKIKATVRSKSKPSTGSLKKSISTGSKASTPVKKDESKKAKVEDEVVTPTRVASPVRHVSTPVRNVTPARPPPVQVSSPSPPALAATETTESSSRDSDATSIAPHQPSNQQPITVEQPPSEPSRPPLEVFVEDDRSMTGPSPAPPPPPPPPSMPISVPKVDYLLQNGGLVQPVPKTLLSAGQPDLQPVVARAFEPYHRLLDDFTNVVKKNGSLAVATGYRSVARRLLDRLEAVFARDISSEACQCVMCQPNEPNADERGVSWGEVLELVSGRKELPTWPAFTIVPSPVGLGINLETHTPMQKLDVDVPEEYRDHYIRQSRKTKQTVDKWLARQNIHPSSPPEEVDDETLTFAILTHLEAEQRPTFTALLGVPSTPIAERAPTPSNRISPESLSLASAAIQRLYRLQSTPREPETAIYLLNNPTIHNVLATLAAISNDEWEILTSGRFDGFLRSGADDIPCALSPAPRNPLSSQPPSSGPTPNGLHSYRNTPSGYNLSRTTTPATYGAPIALDEETEIATLAEIEREIYLGMEALEDAFEALHCKAEAVRVALRERGAGLTMSNQARRGSAGIEVRLGTPASGIMGSREWDEVSTDGWGADDASELAPDDSASNVSSSRRRRPKRRHERRTPAMVEEEDETMTEGSESPVKRGGGPVLSLRG